MQHRSLTSTVAALPDFPFENYDDLKHALCTALTGFGFMRFWYNRILLRRAHEFEQAMILLLGGNYLQLCDPHYALLWSPQVLSNSDL